MVARARVYDVPTPSGSLSYHRMGSAPQVIVGPGGAFFPAAALIAHPASGTFIASLATFATGILFDRRGLGWSDPLPEERPPSLDNQVEDLLSILDHANVERAYLMAVGFDAQPVLSFAARHPDRTAGVLALSTTPMLMRSSDHPTGMAPEVLRAWLTAIDPVSTPGQPLDLFERVFPGAPETSLSRSWFDRIGRDAASPSVARRYLQTTATFDVRDQVRSIRAPMLIMHSRGNPMIDIAEARLLAELAPNAALHERTGDDHAIFTGDTRDVLDRIERFVTGRAGRRRRRESVYGWASLTPTESRVALLVAQGRSNREIASDLTVSAETVKSHVSSLYAKTGTHSRVALANYLVAVRGDA